MNLEWREVQGCCRCSHQTAYANNAAAFTEPALYPFCLREYTCPFRHRS